MDDNFSAQAAYPPLIVLCGFMGSGKSAVGRQLAGMLDYAFADTDDMLLADTGMTLAEMFAAGGERYFRDLEHETVKKAAKLTRTVLATGGGLMTFERNAQLLARRSFVVHVARSFDDCCAAVAKRKNRPLSGSKSAEELRAMYDARYPAYEKYADYTLVNDGTLQDAAERTLARISSLHTGGRSAPFSC